MRDEHSVLPVSALMTPNAGSQDHYLSVPCVIGAQGVERFLALDLPASELAALHASAVALQSAMELLRLDAAT